MAAALKLDIKKIKDAYTWMKDTASLDIMVGEDEDTNIGAFIEDTTASLAFESIEDVDKNETIYNILDTLDSKEKIVIMRRFGIKQNRAETLDEIGKALNLSRERIRQIENSALRKLRNPRRSKILKEYFI